ncbi:uncharacterized protein Fot_00470 [Forsythia ovata]|uniref:Uncharacterized protein n=1 Tax=Forsythia ovata TaxID=205694 RepID=A0ABD1X182_9LAMI
MAASHFNWIKIMFVFSIFFLSLSSEIRATRPLEGEQFLKKNLVIQSLPRGPIPPSSGNPCTYIPGGKGRGRCTLAESEGDFAGHVGVSPAFREVIIIHFAAASKS